MKAIRKDGRAQTVRVRTIPSVQGFFEHADFKGVRERVAGVVAGVPLVELVFKFQAG